MRGHLCLWKKLLRGWKFKCKQLFIDGAHEHAELEETEIPPQRVAAGGTRREVAAGFKVQVKASCVSDYELSERHVTKVMRRKNPWNEPEPGE